MIDISVFSRATDNVVRPVKLTLPDFVGRLTQDPELVDVPLEWGASEVKRIKEAGQMWSPCNYSSPTRKKDNATKLSCLPFDLDGDNKNGLTPGEVEALQTWLERSNYTYAIHHSFTSGYFAPNVKLRLVLFLSRDVSPKEWNSLFTVIAGQLPVEADDARKDFSGCFFSPRIPAHHRELYDSWSGGEVLLPVDELLKQKKPRLFDGVSLNDIKAGPRDVLAELRTTTEKNNTLNAAAFKLGKDGLPLETVWAKCREALLVNESTKASPPVLDWAAAEHTARRAHAQGVERRAEEALANKVEVPADFVPTAKQRDKAEGELKKEVKRVKANAQENLKYAAFHLGQYVPHVLGEATVRAALAQAAVESDKFVTVLESESVITAGLAAGGTRPKFVITKNGWRSKLIPGAEGEGFEKSEINAKILFEEHPDMAGKLKWNVRKTAAYLLAEPPWATTYASFPAQIKDNEGYNAGFWLAHKDVLAKTLRPEGVWGALQAAAQDSEWDPFKDWLETLVWDGTERLYNWLRDYVGAADDRYTQLVAKNFLIGAVALTLGDAEDSSVDQVMVLSGPEDIGKSRLLRALAGADNFADVTPEVKDKDSHLMMEKYVIIELAEIDRMSSNKDASDFKAFITARNASVRGAYEKTQKQVVRRAVLCGTTNKSQFLVSETGNKRFCVVPTGRDKVPLEQMVLNRDQLWAEALHLYRKGEKWYLEATADKVEAAARQEAARDVDTLEYDVAALINGKKPSNVRLYGSSIAQLTTMDPGMEVAEDQFTDEGLFRYVSIRQVCDQLGYAHTERQMQNRVSKALRATGWIDTEPKRFASNYIPRVFKNPAL